MSATNMSGEEMQAKIATARRDAEGLKDKIKRKKDELADTSRKLFLLPWTMCPNTTLRLSNVIMPLPRLVH